MDKIRWHQPEEHVEEVVQRKDGEGHPKKTGTGSVKVERGGGHGFRQIILATSCCPMCSAAREELSLSKY